MRRSKNLDGARKSSRALLARSNRPSHQSLKCKFIDLIPLAEIDRSSRIPLQASVEQTVGIINRGTLCEGHFDRGFVHLARADQPCAGVRPNGSAPFPFLEDRWIGCADDRTERGERVAAPVGQFAEECIDHRLRVVVLGMPPRGMLCRRGSLRIGARRVGFAPGMRRLLRGKRVRLQSHALRVSCFGRGLLPCGRRFGIGSNRLFLLGCSWGRHRAR